MHKVGIYISYVIFRDAVESGTQWNPACKLLKKYNDFGFHLAGEVGPSGTPLPHKKGRQRGALTKRSLAD